MLETPQRRRIGRRQTPAAPTRRNGRARTRTRLVGGRIVRVTTGSVPRGTRIRYAAAVGSGILIGPETAVERIRVAVAGRGFEDVTASSGASWLVIGGNPIILDATLHRDYASLEEIEREITATIRSFQGELFRDRPVTNPQVIVLSRATGGQRPDVTIPPSPSDNGTNQTTRLSLMAAAERITGLSQTTLLGLAIAVPVGLIVLPRLVGAFAPVRVGGRR
jgi:hypothetical protein